MINLIRKQIYIKAHQDALLKRKAGELGVTEAELIRHAIEAHLSRGMTMPKNPAAWEREKKLILSRIGSGNHERGRNWRREELYER
ncbi:MAG: CopG family transcriptional regulator [Bacillota bacterium]